jgi:hypothetical protein
MTETMTEAMAGTWCRHFPPLSKIPECLIL